MKKLESLRTYMLNAVKELQRDPERMLIFTEKATSVVLWPTGFHLNMSMI